MIQNRVVALVFRGCAFFLILFGLLAEIRVFSGDFDPGLFMYYTVQSNILGLILFGMLTIRTAKGLKEGAIGPAGYFARFEMICTIDLLLTLSVYWVMLVPQTFSMGGGFTLFTFDNLMVHFFTPLFCLIDYLLFTASGHLKYKDVYLVCAYPLAYVALVSIAGFSGYVYDSGSMGAPASNFPYFFLDWYSLGAKVLLYIAVLLIVFLVVSHAFYLFDKKVKKPIFPKQARQDITAHR